MRRGDECCHRFARLDQRAERHRSEIPGGTGLANGAGVACFGDHTVMRIAAGMVASAERSGVFGHLDACPGCQDVVAMTAHWLPGARDVEAPLVQAGRFTITRKLGSGSMGVVHEAIDTELSTVVALKVLAPYLAHVPEVVKRLRREIVLGRRVTHPGVCRLFDLGRVDDTFFISMEHVDGLTLRQQIERGGIERAEVIPIAVQLLDALEAIHAADVVHRDIKPSNIMRRTDGSVVILDLGLAGDLAAGELSRKRVGTPTYWSPEQARGEPATKQSDIYAAGRVIEELLRATGEPVPRRLHRAIERCVAPEPGNRFASAAEARRAFEDSGRSLTARLLAGAAAAVAALVVSS